MTATHVFHLREVVDINILQEIQDRFSEATGLAAIIVDYQGKPVTQYSNFNAFCNRVRQDPAGCCGCEKSDAYAGIEAVRSGQPYIYRCHMGLVDVTAPIVVDSQYLGCIMTGQVLVEKESLEKLEWITKPKINIKDSPELEQLYNNIKFISLSKVEASAQLLFVIANYIAEKGVMSIVQQQLNSQNIRLLEEMKARADLEKALKETELKALQSQINPHFLFNTLNTISRQALLEGATKTSEIVFALAELLRGSLHKIGQSATLAEEIAYIKNYLFIKETYMRDRIRVKIDVDKTCLDSEIPLFTLQPLVENALVHGLEPKEEGGSLVIKATKQNNIIHLEIIDDGLGIPPEVVEEILNLKSHTSRHNNLTGLGMGNVFKRLQYYFGADFQWDLQSKLGKGTRIVLLLPARPQKVGFK